MAGKKKTKRKATKKRSSLPSRAPAKQRKTKRRSSMGAARKPKRVSVMTFMGVLIFVVTLRILARKALERFEMSTTTRAITADAIAGLAAWVILKLVKKTRHLAKVALYVAIGWVGWDVVRAAWQGFGDVVSNVVSGGKNKRSSEAMIARVAVLLAGGRSAQAVAEIINNEFPGADITAADVVAMRESAEDVVSTPEEGADAENGDAKPESAAGVNKADLRKRVQSRLAQTKRAPKRGSMGATQQQGRMHKPRANQTFVVPERENIKRALKSMGCGACDGGGAGWGIRGGHKLVA